jgi:hypothetical protein
VLYIIMNLMQLERIKMELKRSRYGCSKVQGPIGKDQKLPESQLQDAEGIYIIMYMNSRGYEQKIQGGFMYNRWNLSRGYSRSLQDTETDLGNSPFLRGFRAKPVVFFLWIRTEQRQGLSGGH